MTTLLVLCALMLLALFLLGVAPTPNTSRAAPTGYKMTDGFPARIVLGTGTTYNGIWFWEKTVTPPGINGGDKIVTSTMLNGAWRTFSPRHLKELEDVTGTAAYDPNVLGGSSSNTFGSIVNIINLNLSITVIWPDATYACFWGYLKEFKFKELKEGEMPEADFTIVVTNTDNTNQEAGPVFGGGAGT